MRNKSKMYKRGGNRLMKGSHRRNLLYYDFLDILDYADNGMIDYKLIEKHLKKIKEKSKIIA